LSGAASIAHQTAIDIGGVTIDGGSATAAGTLLVGRNTGSTGILNVTGGTLDVSNGVLGIGNAGSLTSGSGTGHMMVPTPPSPPPASSWVAPPVFRRHDHRERRRRDRAGRFSVNDEEVKPGGKLRVLYNPAGGPSFEDPNLHTASLLAIGAMAH